MRKLLTFLALGLCLLAPRVVFAQAVANSFDPCSAFPKQYVPINISSATTTALVTPQAGSGVYVCGFLLNQAPGAGSMTFEYGTGTACATGATATTGPITSNTTAGTTTTTTVQTNFERGTTFQAPPGNGVCALTTGTVQQSGWLDYVQQPNINAWNFFDPCVQYPKTSAPFSFTAATTKQIIPVNANAETYVCSIYLQDVGVASTANTTQFEYGTGTACATVGATIGGPLQGGTTVGGNQLTISDSSSGTSFSIAPGNELCAVTTAASAGSITTVAGYVTYVQR